MGCCLVSALVIPAQGVPGGACKTAMTHSDELGRCISVLARAAHGCTSWVRWSDFGAQMPQVSSQQQHVCNMLMAVLAVLAGVLLALGGGAPGTALAVHSQAGTAAACGQDEATPVRPQLSTQPRCSPAGKAGCAGGSGPRPGPLKDGPSGPSSRCPRGSPLWPGPAGSLRPNASIPAFFRAGTSEQIRKLALAKVTYTLAAPALPVHPAPAAWPAQQLPAHAVGVSSRPGAHDICPSECHAMPVQAEKVLSLMLQELCRLRQPERRHVACYMPCTGLRLLILRLSSRLSYHGAPSIVTMEPTWSPEPKLLRRARAALWACFQLRVYYTRNKLAPG